MPHKSVHMREKNMINHLAIIMDGNGRWALKRGLDRNYGHIQGARTAKNIIAYCLDLKIKFLSLYAFSSENWLRPQKEVDQIMFLLEQYLEENIEELVKNEIKLIAVGELGKLSLSVKNAVLNAMQKTKDFERLTIYLAISYGSHDEIAYACKQIAAKVLAAKMSLEQIDKKEVENNLYANYIVPPELLVRTSGECRLSNFLLFQLSYSELYFTNVLWPDFRRKDLDLAIHSYFERKRRFGLI